MKKYIKASHVDHYEREKRIFDALNHDYRQLTVCKTDDDVLEAEWWYTRWDEWFTKKRATNPDTEDVIAELAYECLELLVKAKNDLKKEKERWLAGNRYMSEIVDAIEDGGFDIYDASEEAVIVMEPEDATREDLIQFVDDIKDLIGGRYYGTGRGGSWTAWNLMSPDGVEFQVGINSHARYDKDTPDNTWIVRTV